MTRINVGIPPKELHTKHLLAEHREIKRIPNLAKKKIDFTKIPNVFSLGKGHVLFFYTRLLYLKKRYEEIYAECLSRNYRVTYFGDSWNGVPDNLMRDWSPTEEDIAQVRDRIAQRTPKK